MAHFDQLQALWQSQPQPALRAANAALVARSLRRYGRQQNFITALKIVAIGSALTWGGFQIGHTWWAVAGLTWICCTVAVLLAVDWHSHRAIARLDFSSASAEFVRAAIDRIREQREPFRRYYWLFMLSIVGSVNLLVGPSRKLLMRAVETALPFLMYELGKRVRFKRYDAECGPLVQQLTAMQQSLEERQ